VTTEFKVFTGLTLSEGVFVVAIVAYNIYRHPADPVPVGTATNVVAGTPGVRFWGTVGILEDEHALEGETPITFEVPFRRADYVMATVHKKEDRPNPGTLKAKIRVDDETVGEEQTAPAGGDVMLVWQAPRAANSSKSEREEK